LVFNIPFTLNLTASSVPWHFWPIYHSNMGNNTQVSWSFGHTKPQQFKTSFLAVLKNDMFLYQLFKIYLNHHTIWQYQSVFFLQIVLARGNTFRQNQCFNPK
jgi:hypothetical protein